MTELPLRRTFAAVSVALACGAVAWSCWSGKDIASNAKSIIETLVYTSVLVYGGTKTAERITENISQVKQVGEKVKDVVQK